MEPGVQNNQSAVKEIAKGAIASMVCGITGIVVSCVPVAGLVLGIVALVLYSKARKHFSETNGALEGKGMMTTGLVTGIVAIVFGAFYLLYYIIILCVAGLDGLGAAGMGKLFNL